MKRVASRLALVALLASILGFGWWLANRDGPGPQVHDVEVPDTGQDAPKPPDLASLSSHAGARASRLPRLPRGDASRGSSHGGSVGALPPGSPDRTATRRH